MSEAIAHVLRQRGFRAGRLRIGYQSCDDSTAQAGIADEEKCAANAKLYAETPAVIGEIGPFNSYCAIGQIPIANRARPRDDLADQLRHRARRMRRRSRRRGTSRTSIRRASATTSASSRARTRRRPPRPCSRATLGARRVAVLSDGGYGEGFAFYFSRAARRLGLDVVLQRRWNRKARRYDRLADAVARAAPDAVYVAGLLDANGGRVIRDVRARLRRGRSSSPTTASCRSPSSSRPPDPPPAASTSPAPACLPTAFRARGATSSPQFAATQGTRPVYFESVYAAQAAELLLDAIARSDGTRDSVVAALRRTRLKRGLLGSIAFDSEGDMTHAAVTVFRALRGGGSGLVTSTDGAEAVRIISVPSELVR